MLGAFFGLVMPGMFCLAVAFWCSLSPVTKPLADLASFLGICLVSTALVCLGVYVKEGNRSSADRSGRPPAT